MAVFDVTGILSKLVQGMTCGRGRLPPVLIALKLAKTVRDHIESQPVK